MAIDFKVVIPYDYATIGSQENFMGQVFTSYSRRDTAPRTLVVRDEAGCAEPSHGRLYLAEKHGYVGPVEIRWPPHTSPTP